MIIDFIIEDLMLNSYLQKNFHTLVISLKNRLYPHDISALAPYLAFFSISFSSSTENV